MTKGNRNNDKGDRSPRNDVGVLSMLRKNIILRGVAVIALAALTLVLLFSLTMAWYTNVVRTGGLTFQSETWNFRGEVLLENQSLTAAPGDTGTVTMRLINESNELAAAGVNVSKKGMDDAMQKRMYFYIDTAGVRNGETMERVYVSESRGYTYTLFPQSELFFSESARNAPALTWEWVYDVLGYYVLGTMTADSTTIDEYIRPIVYDYDFTATTFDESGKLLTVDGTKTAQALLAEVSAADGYVGQITDKTAPVGGYYPVQVNDSGYGVWAYLCTDTEIQANMAYDTALGASSDASYTATVSVTGYNSKAEPTTVSSESDLLEALEDANGEWIQLTSDVTLSETLTLAGGERLLLDLNGCTVSSALDSTLRVEEGAQLTLMNGTLEGNGSAANMIYTSGGVVNLSKMNISGAVEGIEIRDYADKTQTSDSVVYVTNCSITGTDDAIFIQANGTNSSRKTSVVVENSTLTGTNYVGIYCKGNNYESGTDLLVRHSSVTGNYAGIYFPQENSTLTVENSTVEGRVGLVAKGGFVTVDNSTLRGIGAYNEPAYNNSGFTVTGDGLYVDGSYMNRTTAVTVTGDKTVITSANAEAARLFLPEGATNASLTVTGGTYSTDPSAYLPDGYTVTENNDSTFTVSANNG